MGITLDRLTRQAKHHEGFRCLGIPPLRGLRPRPPRSFLWNLPTPQSLPRPCCPSPCPAYGHPAPAYGHPAPHYGGYGYEEPKHNCTVQDVTEIAEVCVPAFETVCANVDLPIKVIVDKEFTYTVTRTVCTESIEEIDNEICSYSYQQKTEGTNAKTVEVTFEKQEDVQMVTVCQPGHGYGYGHGGYGHNYCKEVAQTTQYNVPVVTPVDVPVEVAYPEAIKTCVNKPISLPRVTCEDISEERTIPVPEVEDAVETVEKCDTKLAAPDCQKVELTLPKQVCVELVYGYAHEPEPAYAPAPHHA